MMSIALLTSSIWSGVIVGIKISRGQSIHYINLLWFAASVAGFVSYNGWIR